MWEGFSAIDIWASYESLYQFRQNFDGGIYHYTSTKVLNSILDKGCFWASNLFYLNDKQEFLTGIKKLEIIFENDDMLDYVEKITHTNGRTALGIFSISFSSEQDSLQQWITYAKESGVCIGLDKDIVLNNVLLMSGDCIHKPYNFLPLAYTGNKQSSKLMEKKEIYDALRKGLSKAFWDDEAPEGWWKKRPEAVIAFLQLLAAYYKEGGFYGEQEIRAAFLVKKESEIKYFEHPTGILRPYIEVYFLREEQEGEMKVHKKEVPIRTIKVGPSGKQQAIFDSIIHRLNYGETNMVWKYGPSKMADILSEFINHCLEKAPTDVHKDEIAYQIASEWAKAANITKFSIQIEGGSAIVSLNRSGKPITVSEPAREFSRNFLHDNYLSPQGIWVSKSESTYLF